MKISIAASATMALLSHFKLVQAQVADWSDLHDDLYSNPEENEKFEEAVDDLRQLFITFEQQVNYYESIALAWPNFVGYWKDYYGQDGSGQNHWYDGDV